MVARVLCCLFVDLIWRQLTLYSCGKGDLIQSLPSSKPLATIPAVIQRVDREQTGTIFLLIDSGLIIVRCLAAEREHQIAAQQKNEN
jgi:hypothetical protein